MKPITGTQSSVNFNEFSSVRLSNGFQITSSAIWDMKEKNNHREAGWTSADAAGIHLCSS